MKQKIRNIIFNFACKLIPELGQLNYINQKVISSCLIDPKTKLYPPYVINSSSIGKGSYIAPNAKISETTIGKYCSIGPNLISGWGIHPTHGLSTSPIFYSTRNQCGYSYSENDKIIERKPIVIENDVFIGMNVVILDGVKISNGAIIGAGTVVSKDVPPYAIVVGSPMQIIRYRYDNDIITELLKIKWWDFDDDNIKAVEKYFFDIETFIKVYATKD
ncbi:MAG: CatB-related O-acetyltransferase [Bacteroidia bacterium]|nr:CatB-related O-acetyltransferase [Bacteroidia bacterium]MCZ2249602.1 CatB-related O-acetyltransferase [Bacteroidia bacterium]